MRADNRTALAAAARQRSHDTLERAQQTLRRLDRAGSPVTFATVAQAADVSRSWLYRQPDIRAEIDRLRARTQPEGRARIPSAQRASTDSQQRRIETLLDTNTELRADNQRLRDQIAELLGQRRDDARTRAKLAGPCS